MFVCLFSQAFLRRGWTDWREIWHMRHEPDASQVLRDFEGATPRDGEIIAKNVSIRGAYGAKVSDKIRE